MVLVCALALPVGCASVGTGPGSLPEGPHARVELSQTPFFAQDAYQCGPAALAMLLVDAGQSVTPDGLVEKVYLPARRGSLQPELVATARLYDLVPFVIEPSLDALVAEIDAGRPVLVLQNLGLARLPRWHYAVVVGYDRDAVRLILRSGLKQRIEEPLHRFQRTWDGGQRWGLVLLPPGALPARTDPERLLRAVAPFEELGRPDLAEAAYASMAARWPDNPAVRFGLAHSQHMLGNLTNAEAEYRRLRALAGDHPAVLNNLSIVLLERGCREAARQEILAAVTIAAERGDRGALDVLEQTRSRIEAAPAAENGSGCPPLAAGTP
jgi:tetratricopeptide (TPR) repeat protein